MLPELRKVAPPRVIAGPLVPRLLFEAGIRCPHAWSWPEHDSRYHGQSVYFARGPARTVKIGISRCPWGRCLVLDEPGRRADAARRLGEPGSHRLLLELTGATTKQERAIHAIVAHERVSGEWFRGPDTEFLLATIAIAATAQDERAA